jgi:hypothetical protein
MKGSNISKANGTVQQHIHRKVMYLGHALSMLEFLLLSTAQCLYFNATEIFLLEPKGGGGRKLSGPLLL